jgi:transposase
MISPEVRAQIRRYFYAEHWKIGTIARELDVHPDAVRNAIEAQRFNGAQAVRTSMADPYLAFIRQTLDQHPRLRATRIYQMIRDRGYTGSVVQLRRAVARLRRQIREPFLRLETFPGEHYGKSRVMVRGKHQPVWFRANHGDSSNSRFP